MEVTALVVAVPRATRPAGAVVTRSARSAHSGATRPTGTSRSVIARSAGSWTTGAVPTGPTRSTGPSRSVITRSARSWTTGAVPTGTARSWATWSGATGPTRTVTSAATAARILVCRSASRWRGPVAAAGSWARSGAGRTSAHAQRGCPEGAGDGRSGH